MDFYNFKIKEDFHEYSDMIRPEIKQLKIQQYESKNLNSGVFMGILSSSVSISRYTVEKKKTEDQPDSVLEIVRNGLKENAITGIEDDYEEISIGWTPYESPYDPDFEKFSFVFGEYFIFSLRIDKKKIPAKIIQKHTAVEIAKRLKESDREFLSKNEKTDIKDQVIEHLMGRIPSTPDIYEVIWDYEQALLFFFTTQKAANEELETIFFKSFKQKLIRLFPFTLVETSPSFTDSERDLAANLSTIKFSR